MCLLVVCDRRRLTVQEIENAWRTNSDGAGFAYTSGRRQHVRKGFMTLDAFLEFYETVDVLPHVVHFRAATSGGVSPLMTHPFPCEVPPRLETEWKSTAPVLFHNGVLSNWNDLFVRLVDVLLQKGKRAFEGPWGDTRVAALAVGACGEGVLQGIGGGRYVVVGDGRIRTYGEFTNDNGALFSNTVYKWAQYGRGHRYFDWGYMDNDNLLEPIAQSRTKVGTGKRVRTK